MLFSDIMFIGVDGIDSKQGLTCTNCSEADVLRQFVLHTKIKVVVADHSKLGAVSKYLLCPTKGIDKLITDNGATASAIAPFQKLGIEVTRVWNWPDQSCSDRFRHPPGYWFACARIMVAPTRQMMLRARIARAERGADFHSPVTTPVRVAARIMKIWKSPQPIEVPYRPR